MELQLTSKEENIINKDELDPIWVRRGVIISYISIVITLGSAVAGITIAAVDHTISVLSYGIESALDIVTSSLVIWRLRDTSFTTIPSEGAEFASKRDLQAAVMISFLFFGLGCYLSAQSIYNLVEKDAPDTAQSMIALAGVSILVYLLLGGAKLIISRRLKSTAFRKDALITFSSCILSLGILIGGIVFHINKSQFWIDASVALAVALWMAFYGLGTIIRNPWWTREFWRS